MKDNLLKKPRIVTLFETNSLIFGLFLDTTPSSPLGFIYAPVSLVLKERAGEVNLTHNKNKCHKSELASSTLDNVVRGVYGR